MTDHWSQAASFEALSLFGQLVVVKAPICIVLSDRDLARGVHSLGGGAALHAHGEGGHIILTDDVGQQFAYKAFDSRAAGMTDIEYLCFQPGFMPAAGEAANDEAVEFVSDPVSIQDANMCALEADEDEKAEDGCAAPNDSYSADHVTVFYLDKDPLHFERIVEVEQDADFGLVLTDVYDRIIVPTSGWVYFIAQEQRYAG